MIISRFIHVLQVALFILMAEQYSIAFMYHIFVIHSSVNGLLGCVHVLAIVNSAAMHSGVSVFFQTVFLWVYAQEWN